MFISYFSFFGKQSRQHAIVIPCVDDIARSPPARPTTYTSAQEQGREKRAGEEEFRVKLFAGFNGTPLSEIHVKEALDALARVYPGHPEATTNRQPGLDSSKHEKATGDVTSKVVRTPFGDRQSTNVHRVPDGERCSGE